MATDKSKGWIKVYRSIMDDRNYLSEEFCRRMAWVDLNLLANHKPGTFRVRGIPVNVERGQVGWGLEELAKRWKWSRGKVERFMLELETAGLIVRQKNNVTTLISIVDYEDEQSDDKANENANGQQTVKQTDINKNDKNGKNEKKTNTRKKADPPALFEFEIVLPWETPAFAEAWRGWKEYRQKQFKLTWKLPEDEQAALIDLSKIANGLETEAIEIIKKSRASTWKGLFPLKKVNGNGTHQQQPAGAKPGSKSAGAYELANQLKQDLSDYLNTSGTGSGEPEV